MHRTFRTRCDCRASPASSERLAGSISLPSSIPRRPRAVGLEWLTFWVVGLNRVAVPPVYYCDGKENSSAEKVVPGHETPKGTNMTSQTALTVQDVKSAMSVLDCYPIQRAWLYGSVARGTNDVNSDVDLIVERVPGRRLTFALMDELRDDLERLLGCAVDVNTLCRPRSSKLFLKFYDRDKVMVYERKE